MVSNQKKYTVYFYLVTLALAVPKILFTLRPEINLFTEEAQYWVWSQHLAWHYYSKPALVAVLNFLSTSLIGNTEIAIRINAILCGIGMAWVTYLFGTYLYSRKIGFWSALVLQSMPSWWLATTFHTTDSSLSFFWILSIYLAYRGIKEEKSFWWVYAGIATVFGLMTKYVMLLIFPVLLLYLLYTKKWKTHQANFLMFVLISALGFVPAFIWNWQNDFETLRHLLALTGAEGVSSKSFSITTTSKSFFEYLKGQLAIVSLFLVPAWLATFLHVYKNKSAALVYLILPGIIAFLFFGCLSFFKEAMVNWPAFAYTGFAIALARWMVAQSRLWKTISYGGIYLSIALPIIFILPDYTGIKSSETVRKREQMIVKRLLGHEQLAKRIDYLKDSLGISDEFFFSDSYHTASELSFYLSGNPQTYVLNMGSRKNQFNFWSGMEQFLGHQNTGVFVSWNYNTMENKAIFQSLIYEETFVSKFHDIPKRDVRIQVWSNLMEYKPALLSTY
ncbi:ArnT family glycosyltransferase [Cyclobacterium qasimii]|uniref:ArnT family glycosyltransferase n=1 Tax=Cyclobacterium qasimii TaxID=1350429 RepID=UPI0011BF15F1|nr:glycosyltransferase family 39 protein [Cyclobacterium qasimii]